jgi:hypothetical protein
MNEIFLSEDGAFFAYIHAFIAAVAQILQNMIRYVFFAFCRAALLFGHVFFDLVPKIPDLELSTLV